MLPVGFTVADDLYASGPCSVFFTYVIEDKVFSASSEALKVQGESRKLSDHDFSASKVEVNDPLESSCVRRFDVRESFVGSGGKRVGSIGSKETEGRLTSSRTSRIVKAA